MKSRADDVAPRLLLLHFLSPPLHHCALSFLPRPRSPRPPPPPSHHYSNHFVEKKKKEREKQRNSLRYRYQKNDNNQKKVIWFFYSLSTPPLISLSLSLSSSSFPLPLLVVPGRLVRVNGVQVDDLPGDPSVHLEDVVDCRLEVRRRVVAPRPECFFSNLNETECLSEFFFSSS